MGCFLSILRDSACLAGSRAVSSAAMRRFSIRTLMGHVLAVAVAFAALRGANEYWAGGLTLCVLALLGYTQTMVNRSRRHASIARRPRPRPSPASIHPGRYLPMAGAW